MVTVKDLEKVTCTECGSIINLVYHHISYDPEQLVVLCKSCHKKEHHKNNILRPHNFVSKIIKQTGFTTVAVSDENKTKLDALLAKKIGETSNPSMTMDDVITALLFIAEVKV